MNRNTALILAVCCAPALAQSQQPWDSPAFSADPAAMLEAASKIAAPSGTDAVLLFNDRSYIYDDRGRSTYRQHSFVLVLTANGVRDWDSIEVHWEPWHENRPVLRARAIAPDRSVRELDPKTIAEGPAGDSQRNIYSDGRTMRVPLPAISPGVIVEKEVTITETSALFESGVTHSVSFSADIPVTFSRFTVEAPSSLPLRNEVRLLPKIVTSKSEQDGRVRYTFQMAAAEPTGPDVEYLPPDVPHWPYVAFSTGKSWPDIAKAYSQIVDAQIRSGGLEHNAVVAAGKNSDAAEIGAALLKKLHDQVRYTGVEFGDASLIPRSPSETLRRKYGDCKDQATLLVAMLRAAGIPAHVALFLAGPGQDIEPELPGVGIFDHAIVYVPGSPAIWVDPTDEFVRFGELPLDDQGRLALVASETADGLTKIPEAPSTANRFIETREFYLSEFGKARVVETTETWGSVDDRFRQYYADTEAKEIAKGLQGYAKGTYFSDDPPKYEFSKPTDISKPFRLRIEMTNAGRGSTDTLGAAVGITTGGLTTRLPNILSDTESEKETSHRDANFFLPEPYSAEVRCRIVPPPGFKPSALPEAKKRQIGPAVLTEEFSADRDGVVSATLRFDTVKRLLTPAEFEAFRTGLRDLQKEPITLVQYQEEGQALLAAGKIREALEQFRQLVALHPKEALHRSQIARALLAAGAGEQARQEAREATKLEPSSAQAFVTLGWILQHDLIGRRFKKGCDLAGAEAAYRKVKELDPANYNARADLAIVLENSPDGVRYADKSKLDEAIVEYRLLDGKLTGDISNNILYALLWAKRYDELKELARKNTSAGGFGAPVSRCRRVRRY